ncbi:MAG: extracellular solute-binding protein [Treponema sp.]|jgi:multiple sugar transport system substrate-binding protein|nr:extracellular solute-binding protein [Treponema sp.]
MATIKDVAREAGLSIATVSCALSGKKNVSHNSRIKVFVAIEKLNYVPNESARKLKLRTSRDIGVLLTSIDDLYHSEIFKGITTVIQENGFSVNIGFSNNQPRVEKEIIANFISRNFAGIILISCLANDPVYIRSLLSSKIPVVFVERRPRKKNINFAGITNKKTIGFLVDRLRAAGYKNICLFCGNPVISSESDCVTAFKERYLKKRRGTRDRINYTNMTREDAFRVALAEFSANPGPEAIIATSGNIAHGILEGARVLGVSLEKSVIIAFSEETWMDTRYLPGALHTSRPAFKLGSGAASLLLRNIRGETEKPETLLLDDNILNTGIAIPRYVPQKKEKNPGKIPELRILMLNTFFAAGAMEILAGKFRNDCGAALVIETDTQNRLLDRIMNDSFAGKPRYDIYMFDIPHLNYLAQNECLEDISDFISSDKDYFNSITKKMLDNSLYQNRYYSIPFVGGAQLMFYRIDLFEDPIISKDYFNIHKTKLRPPRTWQEFNAVARFFTRRHNPASPVEFGTSCPGIIAEELCPEIYSRIWGFGGRFFGRNNLPQFSSGNNAEAFENLKELQNYTPGPIFSTSIIDTVRDFYSGKTAMLISYTLYASKIMDAINRNIFGKLGFTFIPGRSPISTGWNLGINAFSNKTEIACKFFKWLYRQDVNYYFTILDGQSTSVFPYQNNELLKFYPWMQITGENLKLARKRNPHTKNAIVIPWNKIEDIVYLYTRRMFEGEATETCLKNIDEGITALMDIYGHFYQRQHENQ